MSPLRSGPSGFACAFLAFAVAAILLPKTVEPAQVMRRFKVTAIRLPHGKSWPFHVKDLNASKVMVAAGAARSYLMKQGRVIDLKTVDGMLCMAHALNDSEQVVGTLQHRGELKGGTAFRWSKGQITRLPSLRGGSAQAFAINNRGQIVGSSRVSREHLHACLWDRNRIQDLGTLGGKESSATDINERGQIVGSSKTPTGVWRGFVWENGRMRDLGTLSGHVHSQAVKISESGFIAGNTDSFIAVDLPPKNIRRLLLWRDNRMIDLGTVDAGSTHLVDMNDAGEIVGMALGPGGKQRGFLYTRGRLNKLDDLLEAGSDWSVHFANAINNSGVILAAATRKSNGNHAQVILTPIQAAASVPKQGHK